MPIVNMEGWVSPSLNIRFNKGDPELEIHYPDGRRFLSTLELNQLVVEAGQQLDLVTQERDLATQERDLATQERDLVTQERDRLLEQLRAMGINPD